MFVILETLENRQAKKKVSLMPNRVSFVSWKALTTGFFLISRVDFILFF